MLCSQFTGVWDYILWEHSNTNTSDATLDEDHDEEHEHECHVTIRLRYDSTLQKNVSGPLILTKDTQATYKFTLRQRKFANHAKTAGSLDELEVMVSLSSL